MPKGPQVHIATVRANEDTENDFNVDVFFKPERKIGSSGPVLDFVWTRFLGIGKRHEAYTVRSMRTRSGPFVYEPAQLGPGVRLREGEVTRLLAAWDDYLKRYSWHFVAFIWAGAGGNNQRPVAVYYNGPYLVFRLDRMNGPKYFAYDSRQVSYVVGNNDFLRLDVGEGNAHVRLETSELEKALVFRDAYMEAPGKPWVMLVNAKAELDAKRHANFRNPDKRGVDAEDLRLVKEFERQWGSALADRARVARWANLSWPLKSSSK